jgi:chorismate mutase/prephenate dehydratase
MATVPGMAEVCSIARFGYLFRPAFRGIASRPSRGPSRVEIRMSSTVSANSAPPPADSASRRLAALRAELDRIDDAVHDLLMQRAEVVAEVATTGKGRVALRAGREASIIRRLLARHDGQLPRQSLVRLWRELLAATTAMQGPYIIAVCDTDPSGGFTQAAREHFGALTPLHVHRSPAQALAEIAAGTASVAVLPLPQESEAARDAWWTALLQKDEPRIHVLARLPFWAPRPEGATAVQALVVGAVAPDATENDCSLLGMELALDVSRARLTAALTVAGFEPGTIILRRDPGASVAHALAEIAGHVTEADPRLDALQSGLPRAVLHRPVVLGAYAVPVGGAAA